MFWSYTRLLSRPLAPASGAAFFGPASGRGGRAAVLLTRDVPHRTQRGVAMIRTFRNEVCAVLVALVPLVPVAARAATLDNPGFETGDLSGWNASGDVTVLTCSSTFVGCAPGGGTFFATLNNNTFGGNASLTQTLAGVDPGTYAFGAYVSFATDVAGANFDQGQISLTVEGPGISAVVGSDPNTLNGQFTIPGGGGFAFTPWFLLSGILNYTGPGDAPFLLNINVQDFPNTGGLVLDVDNAFITAVPLPATLTLFASGLAGLGWLSRRRRRQRSPLRLGTEGPRSQDRLVATFGPRLLTRPLDGRRAAASNELEPKPAVRMTHDPSLRVPQHHPLA